ncbi:MAG: DUF1730 domain-containing protein [Acidobacteria bacterium]|nr:DUF1730 domain-containing protein [Acidobacteriota bacterium]
MNLSNRIKDKASELGFSKTGIVAADALDAEAANLHQWLTRGLNADMTWMEANLEKRTDPRVLFPGARSIVVVAQNYYTDHKHDEAQGRGKISRYAWGDDYHDVVHEKLKELLAWIKVNEPSADGKICVDTAPMMDKAWAVRAGIGWLGKHSNVITTEIGSWIFIGSIILNIDLEYGQRDRRRSLRNMHRLPRCVPDVGHNRTLPRRFEKMHLIRDNRAAGRIAAPRDRRTSRWLDLRLRHMSGHMPMEPL